MRRSGGLQSEQYSVVPPCGAKTAKQRAQKFDRPEPEQGPGKEAVDEQLESSDKDTANPDSAPLGGRGSGGSMPIPPPTS